MQISSSPNPASVGQTVVFNVVLTEYATTIDPTGTISIKQSGQLLGSGVISNSSATVSVSFATPGTHFVDVVYSGDANFYPSSGYHSQAVNFPTPVISSITPDTISAGTTDLEIRIKGSAFASGAAVLVNDAVVPSKWDGPTHMRAVVGPEAMAMAGTASIKVRNPSPGEPVSNAATLSVGAPLPTPAVTLTYGSSVVTAENVTPGGSVAWFAQVVTTDGYTPTFWEIAEVVSDTDNDGVVFYDVAAKPPLTAQVPFRSIFCAIDIATGRYRCAPAPEFRIAREFFPLNVVQGATESGFSRLATVELGYFSTLLIRPGVGAWRTRTGDGGLGDLDGIGNGTVHTALRSFSPVIGTAAAVPSTLSSSDLLFVMTVRDAYGYAVAALGDFMPVATPPFITIYDATAPENVGAATFLLRLSSAASAPVTVAYATAAGIGKPTEDFTGQGGTVTFAAGEVEKQIVVPVVNDDLAEEDDTFFVNLSNPAGASLLLPQALGTIVNDDPLPFASLVGNVEVIEGNDTSGPTLTFPVTLSHVAGTWVSVLLQVTSVTATAADYSTAQFGSSVVFAPGTWTAQAQIQVRGDTADEDDEVFQVRIQSARNATFSTAPVVGKIIDDDAQPSLMIDERYSVLETDGGPSVLKLPLALSSISHKPMSVDYEIRSGSAGAGTDFVAGYGTLTVRSGSTLLEVTIHNDDIREGEEEFSIIFSEPANVTLSRTSARVIIVDDESSSAQYAQTILADAPYAYYRLNELGATAFDSSGNARHGTYSDAVARGVAGPLASNDPAADFSAYGSHIEIPGSWGGPAWPAATYEYWVKTSSTYGGFLSTDSNAAYLGFDRYSASYIWTNGGVVSLPQLTGNDGRWHHLVFVAKPNSVTGYVDGQSVFTVAAPAFTQISPSTKLYIGGTFQTFGGAIDEVAFYNRALTAADVVRHFQARRDTRVSADFDGNGYTDMVLRNGSTGANAVWLMNGQTFTGIADLPALPNTSYRIEGSADFDRDGDTDLVLRNYSTGQNALWILNGTALVAVVDLPALPNTSYHIGGTGDFNGDGKPDIILRNYSTGQNALWLMDGTALLGILDLPALPNTAFAIESCGDFNGDSHPDIVLRNYTTGQNALWLMNGTALQNIVDLPALANTNYRIDAVGDFDGDGKPDIVLRNYSTGQNALWLMNGTTLRAISDLPWLVNVAYEITGPR
ncbi:MAG TPA: Calx-beta domain-containing protein [Thermoanaerobaculia bacterium]